jgi:hypothetical protein
VKTLFHSLLLLFAFIGALCVSMVASYFSGRISLQTDSSQEATVGTIRRCGFPVWFYEQASGISIMSGWNPDRFLVNSIVWMVLLSIAMAVLFWNTRIQQK